jgi:hypothetical protein
LVQESDGFARRIREAGIHLFGAANVEVRQDSYLVPQKMRLFDLLEGLTEGLEMEPGADEGQGDWILESAHDSTTRPVPAPGGQECLARFISLFDAEKDPWRVLTFCKTYGVLGLVCEHGVECNMCRECFKRFEPWVAAHHGFNVLRSAYIALIRGEIAEARRRINDANNTRIARERGLRMTLEDMPPLRESISSYIELARQMRGLIGIMSSLQEDRQARKDDIGLLGHYGQLFSNAPTTSARKRDQNALAWIANDLGEVLGKPPARLEWCDDELRHTYAPRTLAETLVTQLAAALQSPWGVYRCSSCDQAFVIDRYPDGRPKRKRPPTTGNRGALCDDCRANGHRVANTNRRREARHAASEAKYNSQYRKKAASSDGHDVFQLRQNIGRYPQTSMYINLAFLASGRRSVDVGRR